VIIKDAAFPQRTAAKTLLIKNLEDYIVLMLIHVDDSFTVGHPKGINMATSQIWKEVGNSMSLTL
jgi:hypothetical protein